MKSVMIPPERIAPVKATSETVGTNWPILHFGHSSADDQDWHVTTDEVRASSLLCSFDFPGDARNDAEFVAALINDYREGRLVLAPLPLFPEET